VGVWLVDFDIFFFFLLGGGGSLSVYCKTDFDFSQLLKWGD